MSAPAIPQPVRTVIDTYPVSARSGILVLRHLIYLVAKELPQVGKIEETLRWGQPAYLTTETKAGSTLRLGLHKQARFALFAHCQTRIIADYAQAFPGWDRIDGNRAVLFDDKAQIEPERLSHLIRHALTYHMKSSNILHLV